MGKEQGTKRLRRGDTETELVVGDMEERTGSWCMFRAGVNQACC